MLSIPLIRPDLPAFEDVETPFREGLETGDVGAVMPVHMFGKPCDVHAIEVIVAAAGRRRGRPVPVLYDAAHALGASVNGRRVGSYGEAEVFSLSVTKVLLGGEGGMVATR